MAFNGTTGDNRFASETLLGYEAGYRRLIAKQFSLDIATFRNYYSHLSSLEAGTPYYDSSGLYQHMVYPFVNGNGVKGTTTGFEITPDWKPAGWWPRQPSYAYLHMDLRTIPGSTDTSTVASLEGSSPHHELMLQSYLDLPHNFEFSQTYRYVSNLPAQLVGGYHTVDARVAWHPNRHLEFSLPVRTCCSLITPSSGEIRGRSSVSGGPSSRRSHGDNEVSRCEAITPMGRHADRGPALDLIEFIRANSKADRISGQSRVSGKLRQVHRMAG